MDSSDKFSACRLCLREGISLINVFDESNEQRYRVKEAIEDLLHLKVNKRLSVPWIVCPICCAKLDDFRNFKIQSLDANERFVMKLNQLEEQLEESPSPNMFDIVDMKTELSEVLEEANPQVPREPHFQLDHEEEMMSDRVSMEMDSIPCSSERGVNNPLLKVEGCATDFWKATEAALGITVPKYLKNLLQMNGFDNGLSMADFTAACLIPVLERFVREDMHYIIPNDCLKEDFYGIFERCPERFRIVWGHASILIKMAEYWKEARKLPRLLQKKNECAFASEAGMNPQPMEIQEKALGHDRDKVVFQAESVSQIDTNSDDEAPSKVRTCSHSSDVCIDTHAVKTIEKSETSVVGSEKASDEVDNLGLSYWGRERDHLVQVIKESLSEKMDECNENLRDAVKDLQRSDITTKFRLLADVQCFLCNISIRTYRVCGEYSMSKWLVSNYTRHVVEQHCGRCKRNKKKGVVTPGTNDKNPFAFSIQDKQHPIHTRGSVLGCAPLEDYSEEDSHFRVGSLSDETPSKKKRSVPGKEDGNCES